jgi:hypothetical protein
MFAAHKAALSETTTSGGSVSITDRSINVLGFGNQTASYLLTPAGLVRKGDNGVYTTLETWLNSGSAADYEVRVTETGGDGLTSGTVNTWLTLASNQEWAREETVSGISSTAVFTVEIRLAASPFTVLDSASITLFTSVF